MPLFDHIRELRNRLVKAILFIAIGSIVGWLLYWRIWPFIQAPYCRLPASVRGAYIIGHRGCGIFTTGIFAPFALRLKISIIVGVILSLPFWLYQLWAFIAPGLYARERRWAYFFVIAAVPLFALGGVFAYFGMTRGLRFLLTQRPAGVGQLTDINSYLSYAQTMLTMFGLAFELPLVVIMLNLARVLTHVRFAKWRRGIIFLVFAFAAFFTPAPDPVSMLALAIPCVVLIEVAEVFVYINDKRRMRLAGAYPDLSEENKALLSGDMTADEVSIRSSESIGTGTDT